MHPRSRCSRETASDLRPVSRTVDRETVAAILGRMPHDHHDHHDQAVGHVPFGEAFWDERYAGSEEVWSGRPNSSLVAEVTGLAPGRALDVGCGEGADAVWLAGQGWRVTALDVSRVALERAEVAADAAGVEVHWIHAGLEDADLGPDRFDLVSAQYPALASTPAHRAEHLLIDAVAPGGHLLVVHHVDMVHRSAEDGGVDPRDFVRPMDVADLLDDTWEVVVDDNRPREVHGGAGAGHSHDIVLRARRRG